MDKESPALSTIMDSTQSDSKPILVEECVPEGELAIEPGACKESMLVTTDSFEEFANEMSTSLDDRMLRISNTISEIQEEISEVKDCNGIDSIIPENKEDGATTETKNDDADLPRALSDVSLQSTEEKQNSSPESSLNGDDYLHNVEWLGKDKHVFILSNAGKPIYSRYGNEDKLAGLCGIIQALVNVVHNSGEDTMRSIHTPSCIVVFLMKGPLILAAVSKTKENETQLVLQLTYVFNQIVSLLTLSQLTRIFEQRRNYDLRKLLSGVERLIDHLLNFMERDPTFLLGAVRCLPLAPNMRDNITSAIVSACSKIKDLVFAILMAGNQLIALVRMKKYTLHPSDIHLVFNLVKSSESFKTAESWTPICLPKFDPSGFLHGHVSYLSEDCQACLMLLTVQRDAFYILSQAKHTITEKLRRTNCLEAINEAMLQSRTLPTSKPLRHIGVPEMRHFIYKCRSTAQLFSSDIMEHNTSRAQEICDAEKNSLKSEDGNKPDNWKLPDTNFLDDYRTVCGQIHCTARPAQLIYRVNSETTILAWVTSGFELYVTFDPLIEKYAAIAAVDKLLKWIKKEEDRIFIMNAPTF